MAKKWYKETIIKHLKERVVDGKINCNNLDSGVYSAIRREFNCSFREGCRLLGYETWTHNYTVNDNLYDINEPWTDAKAWFLGLLWSDGWINHHNAVSLNSIDLQMIKEAQKVLKLTNPIKTKEFEKETHNTQYVLYFSSKKIADSFKRMGATPNKSFTIPYPNELPDEYFGGFYRGLMDGDGCIGLTKYGHPSVSLVSASKDLMDGLTKKLKQFDIEFNFNVNEKSLRNGGDFYEIKILQNGKKKIYNLMYPNKKVPCLHRKRDLFTKGINKKYKVKQWTKEEMEIVKNNFLTSKWDELLLMLPERKIHVIRRMARELGLRKYGRDKIQTSKYRGVSYNKKYNLWAAQVVKNKKHYWIGYFEDELEAAQNYNKKAIEVNLPKYKLNNILVDL